VADAFYADLRENTVVPLMEEFGFNMVVRSLRAPVIDPDTGLETSPATPLDTTVTGIFRFYSQDEINGVTVLANDVKCLIGGSEFAAVGSEPDTSMQLIAKGSTYNIVRVTPTSPGGIAVLYRLQVRK
jgi:hypothetical protein